jgi:hypothetical protein
MLAAMMQGPTSLTECLQFDPSRPTRDSLIDASIGLLKSTNKIYTPLEKRQHSERQVCELLRSHGQNHPNALWYYGQTSFERGILRGDLLFEYYLQGMLLDNFGKWDILGVTAAQRAWFVWLLSSCSL